MNVLIGFPGLVSLFVALFRSLERAFYSVFIPVLLCFSSQFWLHIPVFTSQSFTAYHYAIIPIAFLYFVLRFWNSWRWSLPDLLLLGLIGVMTFSEYYASDIKNALSVLALHLLDMAAPYMLAKGMIEKSGLRLKLSKRYVFLIFCVVPIAMLQLVFKINPFEYPFQTILTGYTGYPILERYGFTRIQGPVGQPILFGVVISTAIILNYWLKKSKLWGGGLSFAVFSKGGWIGLILAAGLLGTLSFAPLLMTAVALYIASAGFKMKPAGTIKRRVAGIIISFAVLMFIITPFLKPIQEVEEGTVEASGSYRFELWTVYKDYFLEKPLLGWGGSTIPAPENQPSIDNAYLFLLIAHGGIALAFLLAFIYTVLKRLLKRKIASAETSEEERTFSCTLFAIIFGMAFVFLSVYMGNQTQPIFFMFAGWSEGFLLNKQNRLSESRLHVP